MVEAGQIDVEMAGITSRIFIEAIVTAEEGEAAVTIRDTHTNIVRIHGERPPRPMKRRPRRKGRLAGLTEAKDSDLPLIHRYTLAELHKYALTVPAEELSFIREAFAMNMALCQAGLESPKTSYARYLLAENGGRIISEDEQEDGFPSLQRGH